jgi:hypothetical protein
MVIDGERYWLSDDETAVLISENDHYQRICALEEMIAETFHKPADGEKGQWLTVGEIYKLLSARYHSADMQQASLTRIGRMLSLPRFAFESKRRSQGVVYWLSV